MVTKNIPGISIIHHLFESNASSDKDNILPQETISIGKPIPKKLSVDSVPIAAPMFVTTMNIIDATKFGAGIKEIIMSIENKKNIDEIQDIYLKGLTFHYVNDIKEVFAIALTNEKVADAIDLSVKKPSQE